ncbi:MAG: hypothetical protein WCI77_08050 [Candidatus Omnitrophota bacterium]
MLTVEINSSRLQKAIRIIPDLLRMELGDAFDYLSRKYLKVFRETRLSGRPGLKPHPHGIFQYFHRASLVSTSIEGMGMIIFTESQTAKKHEIGGMISNPSGKKLIVPLSSKKELFTSDERLKSQYRKPGSLKNIILLRIHGKAFLAKVKKKSREIIPLFVLKNKIKVIPRLGFFDTWDSLDNLRVQRLNMAIEKALSRV